MFPDKMSLTSGQFGQVVTCIHPTSVVLLLMSGSWSLNSVRVPFEFGGGKLYKVLFRVAWGDPPEKNFRFSEID